MFEVFVIVAFGVVLLSQVYLAWRQAVVIHNQLETFKVIEALYRRGSASDMIAAMFAFEPEPAPGPKLTVVKPEKES